MALSMSVLKSRFRLRMSRRKRTSSQCDSLPWLPRNAWWGERLILWHRARDSVRGARVAVILTSVFAHFLPNSPTAHDLGPRSFVLSGPTEKNVTI